ncbi:MAG TPA: HEAT repeat domain-containing protein [Chloroflexia bacterium]|nr:HEAT repeat domain-containing protein [Chloroflexia bacterium]
MDNSLSLINVLVEQLEAEDNEAAYNSLLKIGTVVLPYLAEIIKNQNEAIDKRITAINLSGEIESSLAVSTLVVATSDQNCYIREASAKALSWLDYDNKALETLLAAFDNQDKKVRSGVAFTIGRAALQGIKSSEAVNLLITALDDESWEVQEQAARALGVMEANLAVPALIQLLQSAKNHHVENAILMALGSIKDERAIESLLKLFEATKDSNLRKSIITTLGMVGSKSGFQVVLDALNSEDKDLRSAAVESIGWFHDTKAFEPLLNILESAETPNNAYAALSLGILQDQRALEPLLQSLKSKNPLVRLYAIRGLGELKNPKSYDYLITLLRSKSADYRYEAAVALGKLGDVRAVGELKRLATSDFEQVSTVQSDVTVSVAAIEAIKLLSRKSPQ